jgi:hypothetical protein
VTANLCVIFAILFVLWELWLHISEGRRGKPRSSTRVRTVPRCPVCGSHSPYGLCPNGHAGTTWVDEPYDPYKNDFDERKEPFVNDSDPYQR